MLHSRQLVALRKPTGLFLMPFKSWLLLCIVLSAVQHPRGVRATDDVVTPCELEAMLKQLLNPASVNKMHATALRNELQNILRDRQLAAGEEQYLNDYDYLEDDKRSVAALAAQGLLHSNKRSLATLAKNGQLPTPVPEESNSDNEGRQEDKRYVGALARSGGYMGGYGGKRNVGTLARDFQLPQNGKRNMATMARLGLLKSAPKRNVAAVARYNSKGKDANGNEVDKRNLGALKGSPVHGVQQKREEEEYIESPAYYSGGSAASSSSSSTSGADWDYANNNGISNSYWWYPEYVGYADLDWDDRRRAQKRFLDTSKDPELFALTNGGVGESAAAETGEVMPDTLPYLPPVEEPLIRNQKRHIGAVYRSGFMPSYRALRSSFGSNMDYGGYGGGGGGRFSRSGRARQFVEYFPQLERLPQPIAAVCKRCFLPPASTTMYRPIYNWGVNAPVRHFVPKFLNDDEFTQPATATNSLPTSKYQNSIVGHESQPPMIAAISADRRHSWGTPPRIAALHRSGLRRRQQDYENATS